MVSCGEILNLFFESFIVFLNNWFYGSLLCFWCVSFSIFRIFGMFVVCLLLNVVFYLINLFFLFRKWVGEIDVGVVFCLLNVESLFVDWLKWRRNVLFLILDDCGFVRLSIIWVVIVVLIVDLFLCRILYLVWFVCGFVVEIINDFVLIWVLSCEIWVVFLGLVWEILVVMLVLNMKIVKILVSVSWCGKEWVIKKVFFVEKEEFIIFDFE